MNTLHQTLEILRRNKQGLLLKYPISKIGVFGSVARQDNHEESDIDIVVDINGNMGLSFIALADEIEFMLGRKTDVVPLRSIRPDVLVNMQREVVYV